MNITIDKNTRARMVPYRRPGYEELCYSILVMPAVPFNVNDRITRITVLGDEPSTGDLLMLSEANAAGLTASLGFINVHDAAQFMKTLVDYLSEMRRDADDVTD